jgi:ATP adenylyltransferase
MQFDALIDFIENKMRLSHIYQPLLIKCLVDAGGSATIRQLAHHFLAQDESQIQYYEKTIKRMPLRILKNHSQIKMILREKNTRVYTKSWIGVMGL